MLSVAKKEAMMMMNDDEAKTMMMINDDEAEMKLDNDEEKTIMTTRLEEELMDGADIGSPYELYYFLGLARDDEGLRGLLRLLLGLPGWLLGLPPGRSVGPPEGPGKVQ